MGDEPSIPSGFRDALVVNGGATDYIQRILFRKRKKLGQASEIMLPVRVDLYGVRKTLTVRLPKPGRNSPALALVHFMPEEGDLWVGRASQSDGLSVSGSAAVVYDENGKPVGNQGPKYFGERTAVLIARND
jgi:hypothetical protein